MFGLRRCNLKPISHQKKKNRSRNSCDEQQRTRSNNKRPIIHTAPLQTSLQHNLAFSRFIELMFYKSAHHHHHHLMKKVEDVLVKPSVSAQFVTKLQLPVLNFFKDMPPSVLRFKNKSPPPGPTQTHSRVFPF